MTTNRLAFFALAAGLFALPAFGQTAAEFLQKGIYTQETAGDPDGAIAIYRQILKSGSSPRDVAAQAQYRLAQALLEKGDLANGATEFSNLARNYADYGRLIGSLATQARESIARKSPPSARSIWDEVPPGASADQQYLAELIRKQELRLREAENLVIAKGTAQPDRTLLDQALGSIVRGEYAQARLILNNLINTYPNSDYLPRAKLAITDSWLREGDAHGLAQAQAEYNDFIRFYPNTAGPSVDPQVTNEINQLQQTMRNLQQTADAVRTSAALTRAVAEINEIQAGLAARQSKSVTPAWASMTFDPKSPVTVKGVIFKQVVVNPGGAISVDPMDGSGKRYTFLTASPAEMVRLGLTGEALEPGGEVTITGVLATGGKTLDDGDIAARADTITSRDGRKLFDRAALKQASPK